MACSLEVRSYRGGGRHSHDYCQILIPLRGAMRLELEGSLGVVTSNRMAVIPHQHIHRYEPDRACELLVMDVETRNEASAPPILQDGQPRLTRIEPWILRLFRRLAVEIEGNARLASDAAQLAMTGLGLIDPSAAPAASDGAPAAGRTPRRLDRVMQAMDDAPARLSVAELARDAALSRSQFHALFRATAGATPRQFQIERMLERAIDRLIDTPDPISVIARDCGYDNVSSFNRLFKRRLGVTPSAIRAQGGRG